MSFYEYKITIEIRAMAWGDMPDIKLAEITKAFEDKKVLLGSSSMATERVGVMKDIKK